jgi:hypothetical protein
VPENARLRQSHRLGNGVRRQPLRSELVGEAQRGLDDFGLAGFRRFPDAHR